MELVVPVAAAVGACFSWPCWRPNCIDVSVAIFLFECV
jgi:hypothetical protein